MRFIVYPYKMSSAGSKFLAKSLDCLRVRPDGNYKPKSGDIIINWGNSHAPNWGNAAVIQSGKAKVLNNWTKIRISSNKLLSLQKLKEAGVPIPEFTTNKEVAEKWSNDGHVVMCRKLLNGHSGAGIVVAHKKADLVDAPLYTKYVKRKAEFRIVIFNGKVIDVCQKRQKTDFEGEVNTFVRCNHNGYVYAYQDITVPKVVTEAALKAMEALTLDFGSVDVAFNEKANKAFVFECNSSAGFSSEKSPALQKYTNSFKSLANSS